MFPALGKGVNFKKDFQFQKHVKAVVHSLMKFIRNLSEKDPMV
jgi:hypothetical protein